MKTKDKKWKITTIKYQKKEKITKKLINNSIKM